MRKIYLTLFIALAVSLMAPAQIRRYGYPPARQPQRMEQQHRYSSQNYYHNTWDDYGRRTYYGFRLGVTVATVNSDDQYLDGSSGMAGLNVGFVVGTQLGYNTPLFLEGGIYYTEKGGKGTYEGKKFTYDLNYMEFPVVIKYKYFIDGMTSVQPFFGGFMSCGVGGQIKDFGNRQAQDSFSDYNFRRFDGGLRVGCGVAVQNFYLDMSYDIGLANICHDYFDSSHTGCFFANIGVDF